MRSARFLAGLVMTVVATCHVFGTADRPTIREFAVTSSDLPAEFDSTLTYHYDFVCANPESLLTELWNDGLRVWQAWLPLDNMCMDPIGPRFTVELEAGDSGVRDFGFSPGDGRLHCSSRLKRYTVSE